MTKNEKQYEAQNATRYGYILEWRLKEGSEALTDVLTHWTAPLAVWKRADYAADRMLPRPTDKGNPIRPTVEKWNEDLVAQYGLVSKKVAIAIYACLQTMIPPSLLKHVEWRICRMKVTHSHTTVYTDGEDGKLSEENFDNFQEIMD